MYDLLLTRDGADATVCLGPGNCLLRDPHLHFTHKQTILRCFFTEYFPHLTPAQRLLIAEVSNWRPEITTTEFSSET